MMKMPKVNFKSKIITFSFQEAMDIMSYMEKVGAYGGHKTGRTAFDVMREFGVLEAFVKLRDVVIEKYRKEGV
jgi:hypothetical protein